MNDHHSQRSSLQPSLPLISLTRTRRYWPLFALSWLLSPALPAHPQAPSQPLLSATLGLHRLESRPLGRPNGNNLLSATFLPGTHLAVVSAGEGIASVWDLDTAKEVHRYTGPGYIFETVVPTADGRSVLTAGFKSNVHLWEIASGRDLRSLPVSDAPRLTATLAPNGTQAAVSYNGSIHLWTFATGSIQRSLPISASASRMAFTDGGRSLVWVQDDARVCRWNLQAQSAAICSGLKMNDIVTFVAATRDGRRLLIGGRTTLILWDVANGSALHTWSTHNSAIGSIALSPAGDLALWCGPGSIVHLWNLTTGQELGHLKGPGDDTVTVNISDDGSLALLGGDDGTLRLWALR